MKFMNAELTTNSKKKKIADQARNLKCMNRPESLKQAQQDLEQ